MKEEIKQSWTVPQVTKGGGVQVVCGIPKNRSFKLRGSKNVPEDVQVPEKRTSKIELRKKKKAKR